jgi:hypothetical protein
MHSAVLMKENLVIDMYDVVSDWPCMKDCHLMSNILNEQSPPPLAEPSPSSPLTPSNLLNNDLLKKITFLILGPTRAVPIHSLISQRKSGGWTDGGERQ